MNRFGALLLAIALAGSCGAAAAAADTPLALTIGGRPISRSESVAFFRGSIAYASSVELVRSYGGLETMSGGATTVTLRSRTATFVPGEATAIVDGATVELPAPALLSRGLLFVPLTFFVTRVAGGTVRFDAAARSADIVIAVDPQPRS